MMPSSDPPFQLIDETGTTRHQDPKREALRYKAMVMSWGYAPVDMTEDRGVITVTAPGLAPARFAPVLNA